jgi:hypothetical protein
MSKVRAVKVLNEETRQQALKIINAVYLEEKAWLKSADNEIPNNYQTSQKYSWFLATVNTNPAGVLRLVYDPPLELPAEYGVILNKDIDVKELQKKGRFVEIGRFMILSQYRHNLLVALRLMRISIKEVVERDYTHFITDVFENEPHSPFHFHTRVLGFQVIGRHIHGDLHCSCTRIILTLDIMKAYERVKNQRNRIYNLLTRRTRTLLDKKIVTMTVI